MKHTLVALSAVAALMAAGLPAQAADGTAPAITKQEAKDLRTESEGAYKARKNVAEANHDLNKADCEVMADGSTERACKKSARAQEKQEKADAKTIHEAEKDAIKAHSK